MLENRKSFNLRTNRFDNEQYTNIEYSCMQIKKNLKSLNIEKEHFTNFCTSMGCQKYRIIKKIYIENKSNVNILDKYFLSDELINDKEKNDAYKINRLKRIINNVGEPLTFLQIINNVIKFKYKEDEEIQLYVFKDGKVLNLILIDLYHLGIFAKKNGKYIWKDMYNRHKRDKCNLKHIKNFR